MTDMPDDTDATPVELVLRLAPPEAWQMSFILLKLAQEPEAAKRGSRFLRGLHDSLAAEAEAQKKTRDERADFEVYKKKTSEEFAAEKAKFRDEQIKFSGEKSLFEETRKLIAQGAAQRDARDRIHDDFVPMQGSGISRDLSHTVRHSATGEAFPANTTITRTEQSPVRVRPSRAGA
jgi:hypothetical protein